MSTHSVSNPWVTLLKAAEILDFSPTALRRALERRATRADDGGIEAHFDGIRARKIGNLWRVQLGPCWAGTASPKVVLAGGERGRVRGPRTGEVP